MIAVATLRRTYSRRDDEMAKQVVMIDGEYIGLMDRPEEDAPRVVLSAAPPGDPAATDYDAMNYADLRALAADRGLSLGAHPKKADLVRALRA
jgi:hypothetical protein